MYERLMGRWSRIVAEAFLEWIDAPKNVGWLDVGCGNGAFTEEVIARCAPATIAAVDPSDDQLTYARTRPVASKQISAWAMRGTCRLPIAASMLQRWLS